jgi:hypothetical protein
MIDSNFPKIGTALAPKGHQKGYQKGGESERLFTTVDLRPETSTNLPKGGLIL